ncbi:MAG TPA: phenylalanine 4-monooxygenase [Steroidobacteraceae bacterium]|nr:phenylalanine 4-monooxygenase [Steroidobacteraceae bacterium]
MGRTPTAPTRGRLALRGAYDQAAGDYTVEQRWDDYSAAEHAIWRTLFTRQRTLLEQYAAPEVAAGLAGLGIAVDHIPRFSAVNALLGPATGWRIVAVPGLIPEEQFFAHLAARSFPVSVWIREPHELDYLSEPDLFHDFFGHVPLLANPVFARFMQAYGAAGTKARAHNAVHLLARVYWYTVEFGLLRTDAGLRAYGAGILSSKGETPYAVGSPEPNRIAFDLERVMRTDYRIDSFQRMYFVIDSFEQLFRASYDTDFGPMYDRIGERPGIAPEVLLAADRVVTRGSVAGPAA